MKTLVTFIFVLFIGLGAQAQIDTKEVKVQTVEMTIVTNIEIKKEVRMNSKEVARLYKRDNARIKNELSFTTKWSRTKMA